MTYFNNIKKIIINILHLINIIKIYQFLIKKQNYIFLRIQDFSSILI